MKEGETYKDKTDRRRQGKRLKRAASELVRGRKRDRKIENKRHIKKIDRERHGKAERKKNREKKIQRKRQSQ